MSATAASVTESPYEAFADDYDAFTEHPLYARWVAGLVAEARRRGLDGGRVLDLGCGTGRSTEALAAAGLAVTGCDVSPGMLRHARARLGDETALLELDVTRLPRLGAFDLVTCLNDVVNCLGGPGDVRALLDGAARNLRPGGLLVLDVSTLCAYRTIFASTFAREAPGRFFVWRGAEGPAFGPGDEAVASIEAFRLSGDGWERRTSVHVQRHHPLDAVRGALDAAGFDVCSAFGQHNDGTRDAAVDELSSIKAVFVARRRPGNPGREVT